LDALPQLCAAILVLLAFSAFFSASEMALTSVSKTRMQIIVEDYPFMEDLIDWLYRERARVISSILVGNNLVNVAASVVATAIATQIFKQHGVMAAVSVMSVLIIILGEVLPKCLAMAKGETLLLFAAPLLRASCFVFWPFTAFLTALSAFLSKTTGIDFSIRDSFVTRDEIGQVVKIGEASGALEETERQMIDGVIAFDEIRVSEIMVPRTKMHLLESDKTVDEALQYIQEMGDSRIPVYTETPDHIEGIVLIKDLLSAFSQGKKDCRVTEVMRQPLFVPETMYVPRLFKLMQKKRMHMALVIDEYGGTAGLITMEDLLEEIVGEIQDEYDREDLPVTKLPNGTFRALAETSLEEVNETLGSNFENEDVDSLGGFLLDRFGNFPVQGQSIVVDGWRFTIAEMGEHRINIVTIQKVGA
jgi:CBS domain containing-hemolysin-like protein